MKDDSSTDRLSIREMSTHDIPNIVGYFVDADAAFLKAMGADKNKLPSRKEWIAKLEQEVEKKYLDKEFYYVVWLVNNQPIGHSNINNISFGKTATMHLHIWRPDLRKQGLGTAFLRKSIPMYFKHFALEELLCEPKAENIAPNSTLPNLGFKRLRTYETTPGWINFHQTVNRYVLRRSDLDKLTSIQSAD